MRVKVAKPVARLLSAQKRVKILVGGRGSTKSTGAADYVLACLSAGQLWCCAREFQNTIEESVHRLLLDEIDRLGMGGFNDDKAHIYHSSGGRNFYRGLARNPTGVKSMLSGVDGLWIEEGESLSEGTLRVLTASLRLSAADAERVIRGEDVKMPEILITMNRGSISDPVAEKWLKRAEPELERCGYYEDDTIAVAEVNYTDIPQAWFMASGLEQERLDDLENLPRSMYDHKWHGKYLETVENAIIQPEWFDACIDAHVKLGIEGVGQDRFSYDPADTGDHKAWAYMRGVVLVDCEETGAGLVDTATDWATSKAHDLRPDVFVWDATGMGAGLKRQIETAFKGKRFELVAFNGANEPERPDQIYQGSGRTDSQKTNKEAFANLRAQRYWLLRDRMIKTYRWVEKGEPCSPEDIISFSSEIDCLSALRTELCRVPRKYVASGKIQILSKPEMLKLGIKSPNLADALMMASESVDLEEDWEEINYSNAGII